MINVPSGCAFHPRCPYVMDVCRTDVPALLPVDGHHAAACHLSLADKERIRAEEVLTQPMSVTATPRDRTAPGAVRRAAHQDRGDQEVLPDHARHPDPAQGRRRARGRRRGPGGLPGRDARPGRRDGLRQVHPRARRDAAVRSHRGQDLVRRAGHHGAQGQRAPRAPARHADDLPGPVRVAEPAEDDRLDHRHAVPAARDRGAQERQERGPAADGAGGPEPGALQPLPARVLRRTAAADRRRARARARGRS